MVDNIAITPGTGKTIATDEVEGVHHQRIKISLGSDGIANDASAGAGIVDNGTQRVTLGSNDPLVAAVGTGISPGNSFVKIEDSTGGTSLSGVRALYFATAGVATLTDNNSHEEVDVPVIAGLILPCNFTYIDAITCVVYAIT